MATGTFTYNAFCMKTLKECIKTQRKIVQHCKSFKSDKSNAVSVGMTAIEPHLSICLVGLVWFARYCGKCTAAIFFSYGWSHFLRLFWPRERVLNIVHFKCLFPGPKITASPQSMSSQDGDLTGHKLHFPVMMIGQCWLVMLFILNDQILNCKS